MSHNALAGVWTSLPVSLTPWILDVIDSLGYTRMTPVQVSTIPLFMQHKDVVVEAVTGSGKTLAFAIPILEKLIRRKVRLRKNEIGAIVISPTRELALQLCSVFELFLKSQPEVKGSADEGESDLNPLYPLPLLLTSSSESSPAQDVKRFIESGADIIIGTPGRIEEFLLGKGRDAASMKELEVLVLDEADRLLDLGFTQCITRILTALPKQRRTGLFSATMTDALSELVRVGLRNPIRVVVKVEAKRKIEGKVTKEKIEERRVPASLQNYYMVSPTSEKIVRLAHIVNLECRTAGSSRFIIYFATCACVDYFYRVLPSIFPSSASLFSLHGHVPPTKRASSLKAFTSHVSTASNPSILLCTDVAARGLDLPDVDCVIQFDPPVDPKQFSHRCGRTARAGKDGRAWLLLTEKEAGYTDFLAVRKIPLSERQRIPREEENAVDGLGPEANDLLQKMRSAVLKDRNLHDMATKAFVSFVRAYSKHEASYIFRMQDLDLVGLAKSFALLKLPKMPELKGRPVDDWHDANIEWSSYAYTDKARETPRLAKLKESGNTSASAKGKAKKNTAERVQESEAWSDQTKRKTEKEKRREKKDKKRKWLKAQALTVASVDEAKRSRNDGDDEDDWDELAREERMAKKVKKGQIDTEVFDEEFTGF